MKNKKGFTLIELLVVVLIIGILASIALPQYRLAVEKAKMTEAIMLARKIAEMHQNYYMITGKYLGDRGIDKLDITIPGSKVASGRLITKDFVYSPNACTTTCNGEAPWLAFVTRSSGSYSLEIYKENPTIIRCVIRENPTLEQQKLCQIINNTGTLE